MSDLPIISNPIGWAMLQIAGGWRRLGMLVTVYSGGMLLICTLIYRGAQPDLTLAQFASGAQTMIMFLQAALFFLVAPNLIRRAILRDFTTDMITSHRLTAMTGYTAVLGYLTAPSQIGAMTVVNWIASNIFGLMAGPGPSQSLAAPSMLFAVMAVFAAACWTLSILVALSTKGKVAINGLIVVLAIGSNMMLIAILPGLDLLLVVVRVSRIFQGTALPIDAIEVFVSILFQIVFALVFFAAAARKYHRDDVPAFTPLLAYGTLALWSLLCAVALRYWAAERDAIWTGLYFSADPRNHMFVTLISLLTVACLPVAGAARSEARWAERRAKDALFAPRRPRRFYFAPVVATFIALGVLLQVRMPVLERCFSDDTHSFVENAWCVPIAFLLALVTLGGVLRYAYGRTPNGLVAGVLVLLFFWALPPFVDLALEVVEDRHALAPKSVLFTASPFGVWLAAVRDMDAPVVPGLVIQAVVAAGALSLARRARYAESSPVAAGSGG